MKRIVLLLVLFSSGCRLSSCDDRPDLRIIPITFDRGDGETVINEFPVVSPDGKSIVFQRSEDPREVTLANGEKTVNFTDDSNWDIYRMKSDGTDRILLTNAPTLEDQPIWSPDGKSIVYRFINKGSHDLWMMDADGKNKRPVLEDPGSDEKTPAFSPDGKKVLFFSDRDQDRWSLYTIDLETKRIDRLTAGPVEDKHPQFSPDGNVVIFHSDRSKIRLFDKDLHQKVNAFGIFSLNLATKEIKKISTPNTVGHRIEDMRHTFMSPDGRFIAYHATIFEPTNSNDKEYKRIDRDLYVITADGSKSFRISVDDYRLKHPSWSPDGKKLYFVFKKKKQAWNIGYMDVSAVLEKLGDRK